MRRLLIADSSAVFTSALEEALKDRFQVKTCADGESALELLQSYQPDVLVLNLMLPYKDGLTVLQQSAFRPSVILAMSNYISNYVEQVVTELGVDYTMICPSVNALVLRLQDLLLHSGSVSDRHNHQAAAVHHLRLLNVPTHLDGYRQLCVALPMFAQNTHQLLTKELYPAVAKVCGCRDSRSVEHSIRKAIHAAWQHQDRAVWRRYFPLGSKGRAICPTNKEFICRLAELLATE